MESNIVARAFYRGASIWVEEWGKRFIPHYEDFSGNHWQLFPEDTLEHAESRAMRKIDEELTHT